MALREGDEIEKQNSSGDDPEEFRATLGEHLEDLRTRLIRAILVIAVCWAIGWLIEPQLYKFLNTMVDRNVRRVLPPGTTYIQAFGNATDAFMLQLKLSFMIGLIIAAPFVVLQLWGFVAPGLKKKERQPFKRLAPFTVGLFLLGASFCWIILPAAIGWFASYVGNFHDTGLIQEPGKMVFFSLKMMLAFGLGFQLPLVVYVLGALNLLSAETLFKYWRQSSVVIFILSAVLTPSNDWFSMLMMAIPLVILFIISVYAVRLTQRKRKREEEETEL